MKIQLKTEKELSEKEAWQHLASFYDEVIRSGRDPRDITDGSVESHAASRGICCCILYMNIPSDVRSSMNRKIEEALMAISLTVRMTVSYLCEMGTRDGLMLRRTFCRKMIADIELRESLEE